jgi:hypothetical protein
MMIGYVVFFFNSDKAQPLSKLALVSVQQFHHGWPAAGVYLDASGNIFGSLSDNGDDGQGAVFRLEPNSNGKWPKPYCTRLGSVATGIFRGVIWFPTQPVIFMAQPTPGETPEMA